MAAEALTPSFSQSGANVVESAPDFPAAETLLALVEAANALTLAEIEKLALANNLRYCRPRRVSICTRVPATQAGLHPNPRVGYQHNEAGNNGRGGQQGMYVAQGVHTWRQAGVRATGRNARSAGRGVPEIGPAVPSQKRLFA